MGERCRSTGGFAAALAVWALLVAPSGASGAADTGGAAPSGEPPVQISADQAEYFNKEGLVVFTGKVVAVQGDATLTAERMEVTFTPQENSERPAGGLAGAAAGRKIARITATGSVNFRQFDAQSKSERYATGEKGVYDAQARTVTMTGGPRLWEGQNVIVGEEMVFYLEDKKVAVRGKVNLTVYPETVKEGSERK